MSARNSKFSREDGSANNYDIMRKMGLMCTGSKDRGGWNRKHPRLPEKLGKTSREKRGSLSEHLSDRQ